MAVFLEPQLLRRLVIWSSLLVSIAGAYQASLASGVAAYIPECAQGCLEYFIESNYASTTCGSSPSLECLCSRQTESGFAIGEGALECIIAEREIGNCTDSEADATVVSSAYRMCSNQVSALPNTHATLSTTMLLPSSAGGITIVVETSTNLLSSGTPSTSSPSAQSTTALGSSGGPTTAASTTFATSVMTPSSTATATTTKSTTSNTAAQHSTTGTSSPAAAPRLATGQIVGICVGVAGAVGLALGAIFCARRARKSRQQHQGDDNGFVHMDEEKDLWGTNPSGGPAGRAVKRLSAILHISPPIPQRQAPNSPEMDTPRPPTAEALDRNTIGLAISAPESVWAPRSAAVASVPTQEARLNTGPAPENITTPRKPNLTLDIPSATGWRGRSSQQPPRTDRTSTMTNMTAFADLDTEVTDGVQMWRPPPSNPQSAATQSYYVTDPYGNWIPNSSSGARASRTSRVAKAAELDTHTPMTKSPIERREEAEAALAAALGAATAVRDQGLAMPQAAHMATNHRPYARAPIRASTSTIYQQRVGAAPRPAARAVSRSSSSGHSSGRTAMMDRADSKTSCDSTTTINTASSGPFHDGVEQCLSPVVEASPQQPQQARSMATKPRFPGRLDGAAMRLVPPPRQPDFTASPQDMVSPIAASVFPSPTSTSAPPSASSAYPPPLNLQYRDSDANAVDELPITPYHQGHDERSPGRTTRPAAPAIPQPTPNLQKPQIAVTSPTGEPPRAPLRLDTQQVPRLPHIATLVSPLSDSPATTTSSRSTASSSLLAKRLGSERAAALNLENGQQRMAERWRREGIEGECLSTTSRQQQRFRLPATPTWQPRLTPTRRGEDLFLNVQ